MQQIILLLFTGDYCLNILFQGPLPLPTCAVTAVQNYGTVIYIYFYDSSFIWTYTNTNVGDILSGQNPVVKDKSTLLPDVSPRNPTAIIRESGHIYFFFGQFFCLK